MVKPIGSGVPSFLPSVTTIYVDSAVDDDGRRADHFRNIITYI